MVCYVTHVDNSCLVMCYITQFKINYSVGCCFTQIMNSYFLVCYTTLIKQLFGNTLCYADKSICLATFHNAHIKHGCLVVCCAAQTRQLCRNALIRQTMKRPFRTVL